MAVGQKDIEHWKEPEAYCPINSYDSKSHLSIKHLNFMHNNFNTCIIQCSSHCDLLEQLQYMQKTHAHLDILQIGKKIITPCLLFKIID